MCSPSDHIPLTAPSSPALETMDCSGFAPLSPSEELKLFLPEPGVLLDFCNVGEPSSHGTLVCSDLDRVLGIDSIFPFDPVLSVEDLGFLGGEVDFGVHGGVPGDVAFTDARDMHGDTTGGTVGNSLGPRILVPDGCLDMEAEPGKSGIPISDGKEEEEEEKRKKNAEIATVPVDMIHNKRPFKCMHLGCDKTFRNPQTLKMHHKTHYKQTSDHLVPRTSKSGHNKKIPCRCPVCGQTFVGLYELRRHFGRKHSDGEKMHDCKRCGKKFYITVDLRDHEKLCGERVGCKCGLKLGFKCGLSDHRRTHPECAEETQKPTANNKSASKTSSLGLMGKKLEDIWGLGCRSRSSTVVRGNSRK